MKHVLCCIFFLITVIGFSQETYNNCDSAFDLCPNTTASVNNIEANRTLCGGCEDDFTFCFAPQNSIWLKFTTNETGGDIQISFTNPVFQLLAGQGTSYNAALIEANIPCNSTSYTMIGNCISGANGFQAINATGLAPSTTYYIVLSGDQTGMGVTLPAEFSIDVTASGPAITRPIPHMTVAMPSVLCADQIYDVNAARGDCQDGGAFRWYVNGILTAVTLTDSVFSTSILQNGDIVHVESDCFTSCPVTLSETFPPATVINVLADAGDDVVLAEGEVVQLQGVIGANSTVFWTPSYALSNQYIRFPVANPSVTTTYTMTVTDTISGCTAIDYVTVTVDRGLFIPNTFSPNNDGENDTWVILGIEAFPDCFVNIFNRWGQLVFQATSYNKEKAWDGTGKTGVVNEGVYFYEIQLRDPDKQIMKGSITLIR